MKVKVGVAPIAWSNDDLPDLGGDVSLEKCLAQAAAAGYTGIEIGGKFPRKAQELREVLSKFDLDLASGWYSGTLLETSLKEQMELMLPQIKLFTALDCNVIVYGEVSGTIQNQIGTPLIQRKVLNSSEIVEYSKKLSLLADFCIDLGIILAFHPHVGTVIETSSETTTLLRNTTNSVGLLYDPGHLRFGGGFELDILQEFASRVKHVHTKDVRQSVIDGIDRTSRSFLDSVLAGVFTVPGDGDLDFSKVCQVLYNAGYDGWFVVEAEQDPVKAPPYEYALKGYNDIVSKLVACGYSIQK